jgi:uncharacterized protein (TIGR02145 family)
MKTTRLLLYFLLTSTLILTNCSADQEEPATCSDGIQNGTETGVDCGGASCPACPIEPTCSDGIQNGTETGVDCGGASCPACPITLTCSDGIQNGTETGIDCGGATCPACSFSCGETITDIDGNTYSTVTIGTQCWMRENLKTSKYNDGTSIPTGLSDAAWENTTSGAYAINDNNAANNTIYGKLYNWYAVNTGKLCPTGWHIPSDVEWTVLTDFLGGESVAGGKMKTTTGWQAPNTGATNSSGFSGLPGGSRVGDGNYDEIGFFGGWWSSTETDTGFAWYRYLFFNDGNVYGYVNDRGIGLSCRCLRD